MTTILLALDRASVRRRDANGYLHVETSNISKANVCPYFGREIPDWQTLGLDADRVYDLYRDPGELAKAASTFNNVPLLSEHLAINPDEWDDEIPGNIKIGSLGTDAGFDGTYLQNSLVVWSGDAQAKIDAREKDQLSCGYRYRADMTPGRTADGLQYDGVMRDIIGNHVAHVIEGRAGPDVMVGDELMKLTSRTALMISGALAAHIRPKLAADAKVDISTALKDVTAKSFAMDGAPKKLAAQVVKLVKPHIATDATMESDDLLKILEMVQPADEDEDDITGDAEPETDEEKEARLKKEAAAADEDLEAKEPKGMDAASVHKLVAQAEARGAARVAAIEVAKRDVQPLVGEIVGMDSAESIYAFALDSAGVAKSDIKGAPIAALKAMTKMAIDRKADKPVITQDSAAITTHRGDFSARYPNAAKLVRS